MNLDDILSTITSGRCMAIVILALLTLFGLFGWPAMIAHKVEVDYQKEVISEQSYSFNDSVALVKYNYGWAGGLSGVESTTVTMLHGANVTLEHQPYNNLTMNEFAILTIYGSNQSLTLQNQTITEFTFNGNCGINSGDQAIVTYQLVTHRNNQTELTPISIKVLPSSNADETTKENQ